MDIYIMTRGTQIDYMFLGAEPKRAWWTKFREWTSFEYPTIIFQASELYLSGIPSKRKDRVKTPIRYTLVFEKVGSEDIEKLRKLIKSWLNDIIIGDGDPVSSELGEYLDKKFTEEYTDNILLKLKKINQKNEKMEIHDEIIKKISDIFKYDYNNIEPENDHWVCVSKKKNNGWMSFVNEIEPGIVAAYLNLVDGKNIDSVINSYPKAAILRKKDDKDDKDDLLKQKENINNNFPARIKDRKNVIKHNSIIILAISIILNIFLLMQKHPDISDANLRQKYPCVSEIEISKKDIKGIDLKIIFKNTESIPTIKNQGIETEKEWDTNKQVLSFQIPQKSDTEISNVKNDSGIMHPLKISFYNETEEFLPDNH